VIYTPRPMEPTYKPGQRVRITQQVPRAQNTIVSTTEGTIVRAYQSKTGSWFAHSKDHKLWLDRLEIQKDNGEMAVINLDQYTRVESLDAGATQSA
jgi:hypothetical protein